MRYIGLVLAALITAPCIDAQVDRNYRPVVLDIAAGAVPLSQANIGIVSTSADAIFYNPGMLLNARGSSFSMQRHSGSSTSASLASVQTAGSLGLGIGVRFIDWSASGSEYPFRTQGITEGLAGEGPVRASGLALTAGAARSVWKLRAGVSATYVRESFGAATGETALLDVGAVMPVMIGNAGLSIQYMGASPKHSGLNDKTPFRATLGYGTIAYPISTWVDLAGVMQLSVDSEGTVRPAGGLNLVYVPVEGVSLSFRAGGRAPSDPGQGYYTGGLGFTLDRWSLDYAIEPNRKGISASHRLGIRVQ